MSFCLFACFLFLFCLLYKIENIKCRKKKKKKEEKVYYLLIYFLIFGGLKLKEFWIPQPSMSKQSTFIVTEFHTAAGFALSSYEAVPAARCSLLSWATWEHCLWDCFATWIKGWSQLKLKWALKHWSSTSKRRTIAKSKVTGWFFKDLVLTWMNMQGRVAGTSFPPYSLCVMEAVRRHGHGLVATSCL